MTKSQASKKQKETTKQKKPDHSLSKALLESLVCPLTGSPLKYDINKKELVSSKAKLAFPIIDGIPIMLESEARHLKN